MNLDESSTIMISEMPNRVHEELMDTSRCTKVAVGNKFITNICDGFSIFRERIANGNKVIINGKEFPIPNYVIKDGDKTSFAYGTVFINGYELRVNGNWEKTFRAFWKNIFG